MAGRVGTELAESMLDTAGSLHQLQEELDRISLRYCSPGSNASSPCRKKSRKLKKKKRNVSIPGSRSKCDVTREHEEPSSQDTISLESSGSAEHASSLSSSSRFDSAIGSLHSQTDESLSSQLFLPPSLQSYPGLARGGLHPSYSPSLLTHRSSAAKCGNVVTVEQYFSPQPAMPTLVTAEHLQTKEHTLVHEVQSVDSNTGDCITVMGTQVQLRRKMHTEKLHHQHTTEDNRRHFKLLESSFESTSNEESTAVDPDTCDATRGYGGGVELESEGSSSTVVAEETGRDTLVAENDYSAETMERGDHTTLEVNWSSSGGCHLPSAQVSMRQHHPSALLQEETERKGRQRLPPRRNASILQRLRRKRGSFRRDRQPRRQMPVQRSLSDRFVYHLKKRWEDQEQEEQHVISMPSLPRPIGRLLKTYGGRLHIIQLHKPADGRYGIYITQGADQKIFISRFATATAEKFYGGLLSPGDEIVSVNKQKIRGNSLDSVYTLLSELDSVIIAVVPVTAHRNW